MRSLPHFNASSVMVEPIEPIYANLFEIIIENSKGDNLDELFYTFTSYEKIIFGKEPFIKLNFQLAENRNIFEMVADVKKVTVKGQNIKGHIYMQQIFLIDYVDYMLAQDYDGEKLLGVSFQYKILDQELFWYDV